MKKELQVNYVPSMDQVANIFTKVLPTPRFNFLKDKLNSHSTTPSLNMSVRASNICSGKSNTYDCTKDSNMK